MINFWELMKHYPALWLYVLCSLSLAAQPSSVRYDYRVLATSCTGTMEQEMNEAADAGYVFGGMMGGQTAFGGNEVLVIMKKDSAAAKPATRKYKLLATSRTGTMQKELRRQATTGLYTAESRSSHPPLADLKSR